MINWIKGEVIDLWQNNNKFFILINCQNLGYEIQILETLFTKLKTNKISHENIILWIKFIKKEDSDLLFGFETRDEKNFFIEIINIRGIGSQIGIAILNKLTIKEVINAVNSQNKKLISSVPGIGQKMTERIILELKSKFKNQLINKEVHNEEFYFKKTEINKMLDDLYLTLQSLNYTKSEVNSILPILVKETDLLIKNEKIISFEDLLKLAMNHLDHDCRNIAI